MKFKKAVAVGFATLMAVSVFSGCNESTAEETTTENTTENTTVNAENAVTTEPFDLINNDGKFPQINDEGENEVIATIKTTKGDITLKLFPDKAPKAVENFVTHAKDGYYNGVIFHRIIKDFMVQGGDPQGTGQGGESIWGSSFENEFTTTMRNFKGALCMANAGLDTNGSQFYIVQNSKVSDQEKQALEYLLTVQDQNMSEEIFQNAGAVLQTFVQSFVQKNQTAYASQDEALNALFAIKVSDIFPANVINKYLSEGGSPYLDFGYTVFGQVSDGMNVVDEMAAVETDDNDKPKENIVINSIEIQ